MPSMIGLTAVIMDPQNKQPQHKEDDSIIAELWFWASIQEGTIITKLIQDGNIFLTQIFGGASQLQYVST